MRRIRVYRQALSGSLYRRLASLARREGRAIQRPWSYWYDIRTPPTLLPEYVILVLRHMARPGPQCVGAEWWFQVRYPNRALKLHFDTDLQLRRDRGILEHPSVASALHLNSNGGPTIVVDQTIDRHGDRMKLEAPTRGWLLEPKTNQYLVFPGSLSHGVYPACGQDQWRWWHRQPGAPLCRAHHSARDRDLSGVKRPPKLILDRRASRVAVREFELAQ